MDKVRKEHWLALGAADRIKLRKAFGLTQSESANVVEKEGRSVVLSDGISDEALASTFTSEAMSAYVGSTGALEQLWADTVAKATGRITNDDVAAAIAALKEETITEETITAINAETGEILTAKAKPKRKSTKKKAA